MKKGKFDRQNFNAYLLGWLPEAEAERFDELSFTDDEFADALRLAENDLIDAYANENLTGAELERFKTYYLASPLRGEKVEFAKSLRIYAEKNNPSELAEMPAAASETEPNKAGFFAGVFTNLRLWQMGFAAAALALLITGGWWIVNYRFGQTGNQTARQDAPINRQTPGQIEKESPENSNAEREVAAANRESASPLTTEKEPTNKQPTVEPARTPKPDKSPAPPKVSIASFFLAPPLRGNQIPNFSIRPKTDFAAVRLQLESDDYTTYRVALVNQADKTIWRSGALKTRKRGENKTLNVQFPAKLLENQIYSLLVSGVVAGGEAEIISNYPFRTVLR